MVAPANVPRWSKKELLQNEKLALGYYRSDHLFNVYRDEVRRMVGRKLGELQTASVKPDGFELVHMPMQTIPARLQDLPRDRPIACLCHHGARSAQVAHFLIQNGFTAVVNVHGGIDAWSQQRDPGVPTY